MFTFGSTTLNMSVNTPRVNVRQLLCFLKTGVANKWEYETSHCDLFIAASMRWSNYFWWFQLHYKQSGDMWRSSCWTKPLSFINVCLPQTLFSQNTKCQWNNPISFWSSHVGMLTSRSSYNRRHHCTALIQAHITAGTQWTRCSLRQCCFDVKIWVFLPHCILWPGPLCRTPHRRTWVLVDPWHLIFTIWG